MKVIDSSYDYVEYGCENCEYPVCANGEENDEINEKTEIQIYETITRTVMKQY